MMDFSISNIQYIVCVVFTEIYIPHIVFSVYQEMLNLLTM